MGQGWDAGMAPELQAQFAALAAGPTPNEVPMKQSVRVASTANLTLSGEQTIDGVAAVAGDRILAKDQSTTTANGIYVIQPLGAWTRSTDANEDDEWDAGTLVPVLAGTLGAGSVWQCTTADPIVIGTSALTFTQVTSAIGSSAPANVTKAAAAVGTSTTSARSDHKHDITTAVAGATAAGASAAEGVATSLARSDHAHSVATAAPVDVTKAAAADGVAVTFSRSDHKHDVSTAAPSSVGRSNAEGSATSLARSDHIHDYDLYVYGDGSDGDATLAVNTDFTRDMFFNNLTINAGVQLNTKNFKAHVLGTFTGDATTIVDNSGPAASGLTKGTATAAGTLGGGADGGTGDADAGAVGSNADTPSAGGAGGAGGAGDGGAGGAAGTVGAPIGGVGVVRTLGTALSWLGLNSGTGAVTFIGGGAGGGAGGGNGAGAEGGGGGAGAGNILIAAKIWSFAGTISANGGAGGNAVGAANSGGGGGGGGGVIAMVYRSQTVAPAATTVTGGAGGANTGTGVAGSAGADGFVVTLRA